MSLKSEWLRSVNLRAHCREEETILDRKHPSECRARQERDGDPKNVEGLRRDATGRRGGLISDQCVDADSVYGRRNHRAMGAFFVEGSPSNSRGERARR